MNSIATTPSDACSLSAGANKGRVLIAQTGFLGDVVLATALVKPLADAGYHVYALVRPEHAPLLQSDPLIRGVIVDDKGVSRRGLPGALKTAGELRAYDFTAVVSPHRSHRTAAMLALARIPRRVGFVSSPLAWLFSDRVDTSATAHQIERNLCLLQPLGIQGVRAQMRLVMPAAAERAAAEHLSVCTAPLVGVAPGSAWETKRWPAEKFAQTLRELSRRVSFTAVFLGSNRDCANAAVAASLWSGPQLNLAGCTDLPTLCAIIERLDLLIANDSAPIHIAGAYRVPTVVVFLATHPSFGFGPMLQPFHIAQVEDLACRPCSPHGARRCPLGHFQCATRLEPEAVAEAAAALLAEKLAS
jgi:heptosyltransferase-2